MYIGCDVPDTPRGTESLDTLSARGVGWSLLSHEPWHSHQGLQRIRQCDRKSNSEENLHWNETVSVSNIGSG